MDAKIRDVLAQKSPRVWTVAASDRVGDAAELMLEKGIGAVVVLGDDRLLGVLDERDILAEVTVNGREPWMVRVGDLVARHALVTIHPDQTVTEAITLMTDRRRRHLPVCIKERLLGLISIGDLVKCMSEPRSSVALGPSPPRRGRYVA